MSPRPGHGNGLRRLQLLAACLLCLPSLSCRRNAVLSDGAALADGATQADGPALPDGPAVADAARPNAGWPRRLGGAGCEWVGGVAVDRSGNVVVTGYFEGTVDFGGGPLTSAGFGDVFVASYSPAGAHRWSKRFGSSKSYGLGRGVAVDKSGNAVVTGDFEGTVGFGGAPLKSAGEDDTFVASFDPTGTHRWSKRFGSASSEHYDGTTFGDSYGVALDGSGNVVVTGTFQETVDFGGGPLTSASCTDIFLLRLPL